MDRQRRVKTGQTEVASEFVSLLHVDHLLGDFSSTVRVGSPEWFAWLKTAESFSFTARKGAFVARNEKRRGNRGFWYAYRKVNGKNESAYIGKTNKVTFERLAQIAKKFAPGVFEQ